MTREHLLGWLGLGHRLLVDCLPDYVMKPHSRPEGKYDNDIFFVQL